MKVLLTHELFPPDFAGGGEYTVLETARGLMRRGVDVRVLTTGDPKIASYGDIPTVRLPIRRRSFNLAIPKIAEMAADVDLIQTFVYHAALPSWLAGKLRRKPVICTVLALFQEHWNTMRSPVAAVLYAKWEKFLITRDFNKVIFVSDFSRDQGLALGIPAGRAAVINPGIDAEAYGEDGLKEDVIFFTGKLEARKGIYEILAVARELPEMKFRIMGWGGEETKIKQLATPNVEFVPFERGRPLHRAFAKAKIFLFPTKAETFGLAPVEAMAAGCALISTVRFPFEGIRVTPDDVAGMVKAVRQLRNDPIEMERMGNRNRELAANYTWDRHVDRLLNVYSEVLQPPPAS
jgi:glycosyltransferase involved in cell wall biosynthesis